MENSVINILPRVSPVTVYKRRHLVVEYMGIQYAEK